MTPEPIPGNYDAWKLQAKPDGEELTWWEKAEMLRERKADDRFERERTEHDYSD